MHICIAQMVGVASAIAVGVVGYLTLKNMERSRVRVRK